MGFCDFPVTQSNTIEFIGFMSFMAFESRMLALRISFWGYRRQT